MLYAFIRQGALIERIEIRADQPLPADPLWLDLFEPTADERARVETEVAIALPTREEMREIEPSSRLYVEGDASYMTATILNRADDPNPSADPITFVLARRTLVTLRYVDPRPVNSFAARIARQPNTCGAAEDALVGLLEAFIDRFADILERVSLDLDQTSRTIFDTKPSRPGGERDLQAVGPERIGDRGQGHRAVAEHQRLAARGEHEVVDLRVAVHERREVAAVPGRGLGMKHVGHGGADHGPITRT